MTVKKPIARITKKKTTGNIKIFVFKLIFGDLLFTVAPIGFGGDSGRTTSLGFASSLPV